MMLAVSDLNALNGDDAILNCLSGKKQVWHLPLSLLLFSPQQSSIAFSPSLPNARSRHGINLSGISSH